MSERSPANLPDPRPMVCPACPAGLMARTVKAPRLEIYVCHGCGATLSVCLDTSGR